MDKIKVIAFDADDTLWDNQSYYDKAEKVFADNLSEYGSEEELSERLFHVESDNMPLLGYGAKAVCISMMEAALSFSDYKLSQEKLSAVLAGAKALLSIPADPLPGVADALARIKASGKYRMVVLTKGDLLDQENKLERSGLAGFFDRIVIVSNKGRKEYMDLCESEGCTPEEFLMVGNSFKSDIKPVIEIGAYGVHIPAKMWRHEIVEEFPHPNMKKLGSFNELPGLLDIL